MWSRDELLSVVVTDVLTTWAEVIIRVKMMMMMIVTSALVVETSITATDNNPSRDHIQPGDQTSGLQDYSFALVVERSRIVAKLLNFTSSGLVQHEDSSTVSSLGSL